MTFTASSENEEGKDFCGGAAEELHLLSNNMTFSTWLRFSSSRSEALCRREKRRRLQPQQEQQWLVGLSPACCPTYGLGTSSIGIPIEACVQAPRLLLDLIPQDFTHLPAA